MVDLILTEREQAALRALAAAEPVPGSALPTVAMLNALGVLVPSDRLIACRGNDDGFVEDHVGVGGSSRLDYNPQVCDGPLMVGVTQVARQTDAKATLHPWGLVDGLWLGFRNGTSHVAQVSLGRHRTPYDARDLAMLRLISPNVQRLMRERPTPQLPAALTVQERRVLMRVAAGHSNAHIAESLGVAPATVRKHLEHAYRKLGVNSRVAAVARLQGRDVVDLDLRERLERFA